MKSISVNIPVEMENVIKKHSEVSWDEIARRAITYMASKLNLMDKIASKSKLTQKDIDTLDHEIKTAVLKKYKGNQKTFEDSRKNNWKY